MPSPDYFEGYAGGTANYAGTSGNWWDDITSVLGDVGSAASDLFGQYLDYENWKWEREQIEQSYDAWASQWSDPGSSATETATAQPMALGMSATTLLLLAAAGVVAAIVLTRS